jgi:hypothetical protein
MLQKIEKSAACKMLSVIRFLNAGNLKPAGTHRQLCEVYGGHAMSDSIIRRWVRHFNERRENVHDDPRSDRPSVVNEGMMRAVEGKVQQNRRFTISSLSLSLLHEIVSDKLRFRKMCSRWVPKMHTDEHKMIQTK